VLRTLGDWYADARPAQWLPAGQAGLRRSSVAGGRPSRLTAWAEAGSADAHPRSDRGSAAASAHLGVPAAGVQAHIAFADCELETFPILDPRNALSVVRHTTSRSPHGCASEPDLLASTRGVAAAVGPGSSAVLAKGVVGSMCRLLRRECHGTCRLVIGTLAIVSALVFLLATGSAYGDVEDFNEPCVAPGTCQISFTKSVSYSTSQQKANIEFYEFDPASTYDSSIVYVQIRGSNGSYIRAGFTHQPNVDVNPREFVKQYNAGTGQTVTTTGDSYFPISIPVAIVKTANGWDARFDGVTLVSSTVLPTSGTQTRGYVVEIVNNSSQLSFVDWRMTSMSPSLTGFNAYDASPYDAQKLTSTSARFWKNG
jgi:hypothetical protein